MGTWLVFLWQVFALFYWYLRGLDGNAISTRFVRATLGLPTAHQVLVRCHCELTLVEKFHARLILVHQRLLDFGLLKLDFGLHQIDS